MDKNIHDVEFEEINADSKPIRGKILYYSTKQVATLLNEKDSKIRYYTKFFEDILNIETSNMQKQYTDADIDKLKFIIELKNEGMTLNQIKEYCQEVDFENTNEITVKESNPLSIQVMAKALMEEQAKQIELMKVDILQSLKEFIVEQDIKQKESLSILKEEINITVDEVVNERLSDTMSNLNNDLEEIKEQVKFAVASKEEIEKMSSKNKSWFSKLFK